jgi:phospholipase/carboxylesterase
MSPKVERILDIAGLRTTAVGSPDAPLTLVLLHGYAMRPSDLAPFAHSLGVPAFFLFPQAPLSSPGGGHAWWGVDEEARAAAIAAGPRDLTNEYPQGLAAARLQLERFIDAVATDYSSSRTVATRTVPSRTVIGGFSQGGMLALDWVLRSGRDFDGLVLLSSSRVTTNEWLPRRARLARLPVFMSHGAADTDLAYTAGERLRDFVLESEARVTWVPFEGGHEIPLIVWRALRKFLGALLK